MRVLEVVIPERELFDEATMMFHLQKRQSLQLEHSLVSISKWESKWCKPFFSTEKSAEEIVDYIKCMTITQNVNPDVYVGIPNDILDQINQYINAKMTATWFSNRDEKVNSREVITNEIIYYWMISLNIPFECQKWHINRLLTLIEVCNLKNQPPKKQSNKDMLSKRAALNAARKNKLQTRG